MSKNPASKFDLIIISNIKTLNENNIKKVSFAGDKFYVTASREGYNGGCYYVMEVEYLEEKFESNTILFICTYLYTLSLLIYRIYIPIMEHYLEEKNLQYNYLIHI